MHEHLQAGSSNAESNFIAELNRIITSNDRFGDNHTLAVEYFQENGSQASNSSIFCILQAADPFAIRLSYTMQISSSISLTYFQVLFFGSLSNILQMVHNYRKKRSHVRYDANSLSGSPIDQLGHYGLANIYCHYLD
jgi:hypothetical protein